MGVQIPSGWYVTITDAQGVPAGMSRLAVGFGVETDTCRLTLAQIERLRETTREQAHEILVSRLEEWWSDRPRRAPWHRRCPLLSPADLDDLREELLKPIE